MGFDTEPTVYEKTILSDLQGAWRLRDEMATNPDFTGWEKVLFHIDDAMGWESVRNLRYMNKCLLLVRNLIQQGDAPEGVLECLDSVNDLMAETLDALDCREM